jgi:glucose/arabinose dehydrogenase
VPNTAIEPGGHKGGRKYGSLLALLTGLALLGSVSAPSATGAVPAGFQDRLVTTASAPTGLAFTPNRRLLITSQPGQLRVYKDGAISTALDLSGKTCSNSERGLLGVAVDPSFSTTRHIFLFYTFKKFGACPTNSPTDPVNRVSRFTLPDSNVIDPASEKVLIDNIPSPNGNHNAGDLHFGPGGALYVSVGEGGSGGAEARQLHLLLGKILRISKGGGIPSSNPYVGPDSARCNVTGRTNPGMKCREIYASGLRNPFRFAFDPNTSGPRFFINDVGQSTWEEIDLGQAGADYGWNVREGHCATGSSTNCGPPPAGMTNPIFDYNHSTGCRTITGGAFVPNGIWPAQYNGAYLYADFACGKIFSLKPAGGGGFTSSDFATALGSNSAVVLTFGPYLTTRALYYTSYNGGGQVRRIALTG